VARRIVGALRLADVEVSTIATHRSASPPLASAPPCDDRIAHPTTIAVVTADQFPLLAGDHPELFARELHTIGYWFWELEHVPESMRAALDLVDEIWTGSRFVRDAFAAVTDVPVRHVPIPIPEPVPSTRSRRDFELLAPYADRFVFLMSFDHLSVTERKNPIGAIEAFVAAFAPDEGPVLIVKTMNGRGRWTHHQRVLAAAAGRRDIVVWDEHLSRSDNMALVRSADCMVSLHRSEGLGLHLAEAMWLGTPTIATRYSGNVDFMDDTCALLVGYDRVNVTRGQGVYPSTATWAAPHLDEAAEAMRAISADAALHDRLATAGRARMEAQPSLRDTGELIASLSRAADRRQ
jgi:glycosyltransferase involved in cell wall biosynthesis